MPRFSVIVTADARADLVHRTVSSVLAQTYRDLEVVVVEGDSGEPPRGSLASVRDPRFKLIRQDGSQTTAHTTGVRHSAGGRIAFLEAGDIASPGWLEVLAALSDEGDPRITRCGVLRLGPRGVVRDVLFPGPAEALEPWIRGFLPGSYEVPRALLEEAGGFGEGASGGKHTDLALRLWEARSRLGWSQVTSRSLLVRKRWDGGGGGAELDPLIARSVEHRGPPRMISVIIPAYNAADTLDEQLEALSDQTYEGPWEVIVVDDASTDDTGLVALRWRDRIPVRVVGVSTNRGAAHAWNVGAIVAGGDFLAYCDADDKVDPRWLEALSRSGRTNDLVGGSMETEHFNPPAVREGRGLKSRTGEPISLGFLPMAFGGNLGVWRDVVGWLGGWREDFRGGGEDLEFPWRAQLAGYRLGFAPEAVVHYRFRPDLKGFGAQMYRWAKSYVRLYKEYRSAGLRRRPVGLVLRSWGWVILHLPDLLRGEARRHRWVRVAARNAGLLWGSVRNRVLFL
jgi:glycosyltransferase involved in cell wall biosynthesis